MTDLKRRQLIRSALDQQRQYEYDLPNNAHVELNVWENRGQHWAKWTVRIRGANGDTFERSHMAPFRTRSDAVAWLSEDYTAPYRNTGPELDGPS